MLEAITASEMEFRWLAETMPHIVWITGADGRNIYYNQQWMDYTGLTIEESYGDGWNKPIHPDDQQRVLDAWHNAVNNNATYSLECRLRRTDGIYRWWLVSGKPIFDQSGKIYKWFGTCTDIHEIKEVDHRLRDKEFLLAESQAIAHIGSWSIDFVTACVTWSDEMYRICGVNKETFQPTAKNFNDLIHPNDRDLIKKRLDNFFAKKEPIEAIEQDFRIIFSDGTVRVIRSRGGLQYDQNKIPICIMGTVYDITERVYLEQQDKQKLKELAHVTRLGLMGQMASGIAHEVNQPLCAIATYTQVSINLIKTENPNLVKLTEVLFKTQEQALRAGQIIHRMKEFGKSQTQKHVTTDINALIYNATGFCIAELKHNHIKPVFDLSNDLLPVFVDHIQIEQVIINLIKNSIDALQDLPPNIQRQLTIHSFLASNNAIQVSVKDNGLGIDENEKQKILTPFHTTKKDGTGMGLSISRSLIEAYGGTLYFNSELGKGSTFYFTLPIETAERERGRA
jgi:PAS domain S-box-containing protein